MHLSSRAPLGGGRRRLILGLLFGKRHCTMFCQKESRGSLAGAAFAASRICLKWGIEKGQNTEEDVSGGIALNSAFYKEYGHVSRPSFAVSPIRDDFCPN